MRNLQEMVLTLHHDVHLNFADAALGASAEVPTLTGKAKIKIAPGTQSGKTLRLKGKGIPVLNSYETGDILIHINLWTPQTLSSDEKEIMEKFKASPNFQPNPKGNEKSFFNRMKEFFA